MHSLRDVARGGSSLVPPIFVRVIGFNRLGLLLFVEWTPATTHAPSSGVLVGLDDDLSGEATRSSNPNPADC